MALKRFIVYTDYTDYKQDKEEKLQGAFIGIISVRSKIFFWHVIEVKLYS